MKLTANLDLLIAIEDKPLQEAVLDFAANMENIEDKKWALKMCYQWISIFKEETDEEGRWNHIQFTDFNNAIKFMGSFLRSL